MFDICSDSRRAVFLLLLFFPLFLICFCSQLSYSLAFPCTLAGLQFILYLCSSPTTTAVLVSTLGLELLQALLEMKSVTLEEIRSYLPSHSTPPTTLPAFYPVKSLSQMQELLKMGTMARFPSPLSGMRTWCWRRMSAWGHLGLFILMWNYCLSQAEARVIRALVFSGCCTQVRASTPWTGAGRKKGAPTSQWCLPGT